MKMEVCCLDAHIAKLCSSIDFNVYSVGKIRKYLDVPTVEKMINATVTSRLDYCNSLLYGAKQSHIGRLQCCQNNAARIISKRRKFDHVSPVLRNMYHHGPSVQRINISSIRQDGGLKHLESELSPRQPRPFAGNPLPLSVKQAPSIDSFKIRVKTYLFNKGFW